MLYRRQQTHWLSGLHNESVNQRHQTHNILPMSSAERYRSARALVLQRQMRAVSVVAISKGITHERDVATVASPPQGLLLPSYQLARVPLTIGSDPVLDKRGLVGYLRLRAVGRVVNIVQGRHQRPDARRHVATVRLPARGCHVRAQSLAAHVAHHHKPWTDRERQVTCTELA